jgi:hypothetical protein
MAKVWLSWAKKRERKRNRKDMIKMLMFVIVKSIMATEKNVELMNCASAEEHRNAAV